MFDPAEDADVSVQKVAKARVQRTSNQGHVPAVIGQLRAVCADRAMPELDGELDRLSGRLAVDLARIEAMLSEIAAGTGPVEHSARHLLELGGKRLRPLLVLLAADGRCSTNVARELAMA